MIKEALQKYQNLIEAGFSKSTYIISQIAVAYHNIRGEFFHLFRDVSSSEERRGVKTALVLVLISDIDQALAMFNELRDRDPYRIDNMDTFSNLLYVKVSLLFKPYNVRFGLLSLVKGSKSKSQKIMILIFCWVLEYEARVELLGPQPGGD